MGSERKVSTLYAEVPFRHPLVIHQNKWLVDQGESDWTFGQTLAMLLVGFPLYKGVVKPAARAFRSRRLVPPPESSSGDE